MDENEDILFNECKLQITKTGRAMNILSYVAVASMIGLVVGGLVLLAYGSRIDTDMPHYLELLISFFGIACIFISALLVPPMVYMRRAVHAAKQVEIGNELFPAADFLHQSHLMWRYLTVFITAVAVLTFIVTVAVSFYVLSIRHPF